MKIFVPFADEADQAAFGALPDRHFVFVDAEVSHWRPSPSFDAADYLARCLAVARREAVDAVLSTHDLGDLAAAIIARELGLPGPSPEAVFLCLHKHYGRLRESQPLASRVLPLATQPEALLPLGYPFYVKPPWLKIGLLGFRIEGPAELERALVLARRDLPAWARQYRPLFEAAVDVERYPLIRHDFLLAEEYIDGPQVTVEGFVHEGEFHLWAITDTNPFPGTRAIDNFSLPSRHPEATQAQLTWATRDIARRVGFDGGFLNAEFWCQPEGPRLIEINGRSAACFSELYRGCFGIDHLAALVDLAGGQRPRELPTSSGRCGGQFNLVTFGQGYAGDFLDYEAARGLPEVAVFRPADEAIEPVSEFGTVLGQFELFGPSYEAIHTRATALRRLLLRRPEFSPG